MNLFDNSSHGHMISFSQAMLNHLRKHKILLSSFENHDEVLYALNATLQEYSAYIDYDDSDSKLSKIVFDNEFDMLRFVG